MMRDIRRILVTRTDRIGDVVLSLPVIKELRRVFPSAYIAVMVSPVCRALFKNNRYIDEIIVLDKGGGVLRIFSLIQKIRHKRFDMAIILHSTKRVNLICFLAGIHKRVGYARKKWDFLLTDRIPYLKRFGEKHESEYSLDVLRFLGIGVEPSIPMLEVSKDDEAEADGILGRLGIRRDEKFIILNPGASCISKMWPYENFARLADALIEEAGLKILIVSSREQAELAWRVKGCMRHEGIVLCETMPLYTLAAIFKRGTLFISNDSGPAHMAAAVDTPVITIFGRNQKGLSPVRWRPLGKNCVIFHKDVGCVECLAHNCKRGFLCLKAIRPEEVMEKAKELLGL